MPTSFAELMTGESLNNGRKDLCGPDEMNSKEAENSIVRSHSDKKINCRIRISYFSISFIADSSFGIIS